MADLGFRAFDRGFIGAKLPGGGYEFRTFFDRPAIERRVDKKTRRVLAGTGAYVRKAIRNSMKPSPKGARTAYLECLIRYQRGQATSKELQAKRSRTVSAPGNPPFYHSRLLKDRIYFAYEKSTRSVVIGPVRFDSQYTKAQGMTGAELLEYGGTAVLLRGGSRFTATIKPRPYIEPQRDKAMERFRTFMAREAL